MARRGFSVERERFDDLARVIATKRSRRGAVATFLGLAVLGHGAPVAARPGKARGKGHGTGSDHGHGHGHGHDNDEVCAALACEKTPVPEGSKPEFCCKGGFCSCGGACCDRACFQTGLDDDPAKVFCCTGKKKVICQVEFEGQLRDTCCEGSCANSDVPGTSALAGSYRRPGR